MTSTKALFLPSANWYCSQLAAWGQPRDGSKKHYFAFGCKTSVGIYMVEQVENGDITEPQYVAEVRRGKHDKKVTSVAFIYSERNELLLLCSGEEGSIQVWSLTTLEMLDIHKKHKAEVMAISCKDDNTIIGGDRNGSLSVWHRKIGNITTYIPISNDCIYCLEASPDQNPHVAIGYRSGKLILYDYSEGNVVHKFKGHDEEIHAVHWRPNSVTPILASSSRDKKIKVWEGTELIHEWNLPRPKKNLSTHQMGRLWLTFCWIPTSNFGIVSSSVTGDMLRFEWTPKQKKASIPTVFKYNHTRLVFNIAPLIISRTDVWLLSISMDREIHITNLKSTQCHSKLLGLGGHVYSIIRNKTNGYLAAGIGDQTIRVIDQNGKSAELIWKGLQSKITALCWHPQSPSLLAYGTEEGQLGIYNIQSQEHKRFKSQHKSSVHQLIWYLPNSKRDIAADWVQSLEDMDLSEATASENESTYHSSSYKLWSCCINGTFYSTNSESPETISSDMCKLLKIPHASSFEVMDEKEMVAIGTPEGCVHIYLKESFELAHTYFDHKKSIKSIAWCSATSFLATGSCDSTIQVYDFAGGAFGPPSYTLLGHNGSITSMMWSPSGVYLASASFDTTIQVWGMDGNRNYNYRGHHGKVFTLTWIDDSKLVSGGEDQSIQEWTYKDLKHESPPKPKTLETDNSVVNKKEKVVQSFFHGTRSHDTPVSTFVQEEYDHFIREGDFIHAARILVLNGRIEDALKLLSRHGKLNHTWLSYAPMAGTHIWKEYTRLFAIQCLENKEYRDSALSFLSIGEVYSAIESFVKGRMWPEALALAQLRCYPTDPIIDNTYTLYLNHLNELENWEEAGDFLSSNSKFDKAITYYLKSDQTLMKALKLMDSSSYSTNLFIDIAIRGLLVGENEVVVKAMDSLEATSSEKFFLQAYLYYLKDHDENTTPVWTSDPLNDLWASINLPNAIELPIILQSKLDAMAMRSKTFWSDMISLVETIQNIDDLEGGLTQNFDKNFQKLAQNRQMEFKVVKSLCQMCIDLYQEYFVGAFESFQSCLAFVSATTSECEESLLRILALVFPCGLTTEFPLVGELMIEIESSTQLWISFFLYQCIGFSRYLRSIVVTEENQKDLQDALLFVIKWINELLPASKLQINGEDHLKLGQSALNDLSLCYHQLLDDKNNEEE